MNSEPVLKRAVAFIDGQNLFHCAREAFGHRFPSYDAGRLSLVVCQAQGWVLRGVRFYTGIPEAKLDPYWHGFWTRKLAQMGREGIHVYARPLRRRRIQTSSPFGTPEHVWVSEEKGIDVRIAIDVIRLAHRRVYDVALLFSQDQDFVEVAEEIREIAREQGRWIKIASAFPWTPAESSVRGIAKTDWIRIDRATYDSCVDARDHRSRRPPRGRSDR
jgi:uncharacterized LabA/DUF88 family protein